MPSPLCEVKENAGAYGATTDGVEITPGSDVTIRLISPSGVDTWAISCLSSDDSSSTGNIVLDVDPLARTATFTMSEGVGRCYRFQSQVNSGIDRNGVAQSTYTTTFCIYALTTGGTRVHAIDETTEGGAFGWGETVNALSRTVEAPGTTTQTTFQATGNARRKIYQAIVDATTSDATVTTIYSWTITDEAITNVVVEVDAIKTDGSVTASYVRRCRIKRDGGTVTVGTVETTFTDEEAGFAACDVTIDNSGSTGRVRVTGVAATNIQWGASISRTETTHA